MNSAERRVVWPLSLFFSFLYLFLKNEMASFHVWIRDFSEVQSSPPAFNFVQLYP